MVKRYELTEMNPYGYESHREMKEDADGDYVSFEDYAALEGRYNLMTKSRDQWKKWAEELDAKFTKTQESALGEG